MKIKDKDKLLKISRGERNINFKFVVIRFIVDILKEESKKVLAWYR